MATKAAVDDETKPTTDDATEGSKKVDLTQDELNKAIDARLGRAKSKHDAEVKARDEKIADLEEKLTAATKSKEKVKKKPAGDGEEEDENVEEIFREKYKGILATEDAKLKAEAAKRQAAEKDAADARADALKTRKQVAMARAMQKSANFYDIGDVEALTDRMITFDEDLKRFVVLDHEGKPMENSKLDPMTLEEFYADFAAKRPYLVNGDMIGGAGSSESTKGKSSLGVVRSKADLKDWKSKSEFIDKMGEEAYAKLPAK